MVLVVGQTVNCKKLDNYDIKILRGLSRDGRISWRDLAEEIGLSLTPTLRRVRLLEEAGFIEGYKATLNERLIGSVVVFVSISLERQDGQSLKAFEQEVAKFQEVLECYLLTGRADYLLRVVVRDLEHYGKLLDELTHINGVAHIQSSFALKAFVNQPELNLPSTQ
jgi:DNA-binding Lrp family transcriptional regulator